MRDKKRLSAFTLLEILIGVAILSVLTAASVAGYSGYRDNASILVDQTNQKVLAAAIKLYAYDNNALPGSLGKLRPQDLDRAYAMVTLGKQRYTLLAYLKNCLDEDVAEAVSLPARYYQNNDKILHCPSDRTGAASSYTIGATFADKGLSVLLDPANANADLVVETVSRHRGSTTAVRTRGNGTFYKHNASTGGDD